MTDTIPKSEGAMSDFEPCLRSPDTSERCQLHYKHEGPCRFTGTIQKSEVARVLAAAYAEFRDGYNATPRSAHSLVLGACAVSMLEVADALQIRPEFESALKALEEEQGRG